MSELPRAPAAPSWLLGFLELPRAVSEASALLPTTGRLRDLPPGDGHAVITLPGFLAAGGSMRLLRNYLAGWGYDARCWGLGRNLGLSRNRDVEALLDERLANVVEESGGKVSLIGWSLGGLFARELARRHPDKVRNVLLLGGPIGDPRATNAWRLFEAVSGIRIDDAALTQRIRRLRDPVPDVPMTAIYSRTDAVVSSEIARLPPGPLVENVGVTASHFGMGFNPAVLYLIADRLRQAHWRRFAITGWRGMFYH